MFLGLADWILYVLSIGLAGINTQPWRPFAVAAFCGTAVYAQASRDMERTLAGQHVEFDLDLPSSAGEARVVHVVYAPDRDSSGRVIGFVGVITDVTKREQSEPAV